MDDVHALTPAYALHALSPEEERAFEDHLGRCDDCRAELAQLRETAAALAFAADGPGPPPELRGRILETVRADNVVAFPRRRVGAYVAAAAAAAAIVVAVPLGLWVGSLSEQLDEERAAARIVADPEARSVPLEGVGGRLVVASDGAAALILSGLEPAPAGKDYEIWVIEDGEALPAGLFDDPGARDVVPLERPVRAGATVAVTLEEDGGVAQSANDPLFSATVS